LFKEFYPMATYHVALVLVVDADTPQEAAEAAHRWCTDSELGADTEFHVVEAKEPDEDCPLLAAVEAVPGVAVIAGDGTPVALDRVSPANRGAQNDLST
jgi:hypothetical protein